MVALMIAAPISRTRALLALLACACATIHAPPARAAALDKPPRTIDELKAQVARVLERNRVPGVGLALVAGDRLVWAGGVGLADRDARRPVTADTLFRVGSITKSFVALALVKLAEEGRIDLSARISDVAPELAIENRWAAEAPITVAHVLEHTAGFDDMHFNEFYAPLAVEGQPLAQILARNPRSRVARWRPGSRFSYANPGYTVAAYLIEKASRRPWADYIRDELLRPLGMNGAALRWTPEVDARLARGYDDAPGAVPYRAIYHFPAGNLMASPRELAALVRLWLARGRAGGRAIVSPAGLARTERCETCAIGGLDIDYGLGNHGDASLWGRARGHGGGIDGFLSLAVYLPERGVGFVILLNSTASGAGPATAQIRTLVADYLTGGVRPTPPPAVDVPEAELRAWVGHYRFANPRMQLFAFLQRMHRGFALSVDHGRLLLDDSLANKRVELTPLGRGRFRYPGVSGSHVAVGRDADGRRVLFNWGLYLVEEPAWVAPLFDYGVPAVFWLLVSALALPIAALVWRGRAAPIGWAWPLLSTTSLFAVPALFIAAALSHTLGERNAYTVGICAFTVAFAAGAVAATVQAVRRLGPAAAAHRAPAPRSRSRWPRSRRRSSSPTTASSASASGATSGGRARTGTARAGSA